MSVYRGLEWTEYSDGEVKLFVELQRRGLTMGLNTHVRIKLDAGVDGVEGTEIDFYWGPEDYKVFLDGEEVHSSWTSERRDALVTAALARRGGVVDRFRYSTPMSDKKCREIADTIEKTLEGIRKRNK